MHPADSFLGSCLSYVKRAAVSRAPGNDAHNLGAKRSPANAGPGAQIAKTPHDKRTKTGKSLEDGPGSSASCVLKQGEDRCKWANDNLAAAAKKIEAHWKRTNEAPPGSHMPGGDEEWDGEGDYGELLEAETACMLALLQDSRSIWPGTPWISSTTTVLPPPPPTLRRG